MRCKLLVTAEAGPDDTFSLEIQPRASTSPSSSGFSSSTSSSHVTSTEDPDATYAETFPEAYQDATAPFRPNVSSYEPSLSADALENGPPNQARRPGSSCSTGEATATAPTLDARQSSPARTSASRTSARAQPAVGDVWGVAVGVRGTRMVVAAAFIAVGGKCRQASHLLPRR